jgi:ribonucleoside-diphosphate reductase alpha chain
MASGCGFVSLVSLFISLYYGKEFPMVQSRATKRNALHELGYKIFLDRYAQKDMTRATLKVGDTVIVVINSATGQREVGVVKEMNLPKVTVELLDGEVVTRDLEHVDKPIETEPEQMMERVARGIAAVEATPELRDHWSQNFRWLLDDWKFVPGGRILTGAGTNQKLTFYNCYVVPSPRDSRSGIIETLSQMTEIMSRGGGVGINISTLRPRHAYVKGVNGRSSGSVSWGALYSFVTGLIEQGGSRRGALMLILNDWHPDIFDFINSKRKAGQITNANISVGISDSLMEAIKADGDWDLMFPDTGDPDYDELWDGDLETWMAAGRKVVKYKTVKARELWNAVIESAWASAEPGIWFRERSNKMANSWYFNPLISTNPCVTGDTLVETEFGYTKARDLHVGMRIRTPAGLKPIEKVYNNGVQSIYRVEFSDGGYLECTHDHKLKVVRDKWFQWVSVAELKQGDKVQVMANEAFGSRRRLPEELIDYVQKRKLNVADIYDRQLGFMVGVVTGDGTLRKVKSGNSYGYQCKVAFGANEPEWLSLVQERLSQLGIHSHLTLIKKDIPQPDGTVVAHQAVSLECYKLATLLVKAGMPTNTKAPDKTLPEEFMNLDREFLAGVLDGLFSTDGGINMQRSNPKLRFHTSSNKLAQQVRLMLLQFGIHARIYTSHRDESLTYDGRSMYGTGKKYDVLIMNEGVARFYSEIGLSHPDKASKLKEIAENCYFIGGSWVASVVSVEDTGREEEVFDVYEPNTVTWVTNGYVSFDCGEQPLSGWSVCNLGALNLAKFYDYDANDVAWESLGRAVQYATRFLDDVIDSTPYFFEENKKMQLSERRVGLGTMGMAELMIRLGVRYGSDESVEFIDKLYKFIATEAYKTSSGLANEKGAFPMFEAETFLESGYMQGMPEDVRESVRNNGIRNVTLLTIAPTGTTGTLVNTSTGVEPFFSWVYYRKSRLGLHEEKVPLVQEWQEAHPGQTDLPDYFVTAMELTPDEHVRVQGAIQRWVDSAISKTANVPNDYTVEQVGKLYEYMYELGCKGGTIYRDGSRDEQVLMLKGDERAESEKESLKKKAEPVAKEIVAQVATPHHVWPRPKKLTGVTVSRKTPFGTAFITMNSDDHGNPFEVFITVGKAGSDLQADAEGLGRMLSLQLRTTAPGNRMEMLKLIIDQLEGIGGARSIGFGNGRVMSLPDAVAGALREQYLNDEMPEQLGLPMGDAEPAPKVVSGPISGADICPECGTVSLIREEGCRRCLVCSYTEC